MTLYPPCNCLVPCCAPEHAAECRCCERHRKLYGAVMKPDRGTKLIAVALSVSIVAVAIGACTLGYALVKHSARACEVRR